MISSRWDFMFHFYQLWIHIFVGDLYVVFSVILLLPTTTTCMCVYVFYDPLNDFKPFTNTFGSFCHVTSCSSLECYLFLCPSSCWCHNVSAAGPLASLSKGLEFFKHRHFKYKYFTSFFLFLFPWKNIIKILVPLILGDVFCGIFNGQP